MIGMIFAVAWFDENLKVYQMHWHSLFDEDCIGPKLDYSLEDLEPAKLQVEQILLDCGVTYTPPA